ncbi:metal ABC transporter ATP-binding protein [SAR202 cluster bacterium AC-409-J13_OGT_754m]|nr:metal ABC transporter ATP-binding protein [SAR202 cluster bacterium AC-409-J13_OGT_754m]
MPSTCPCLNEGCNCCIQVFNACIEFENQLALDSVSFAVPPGVLTGVVGPNGAGKSILFNALVGLQPLAHGKILINGCPPKNSKTKISYIPQKERVNWRFPLSVRDVVSLGTAASTSLLANIRITSRDNDLIEESLRKVDMWHKKDHLVSTLSGGQRQRTFIARALTQNADILILDEAFSGVDISSQEGMLQILRGLRDEGKTILVATHDLNTLAAKFDYVLCINRHICAYGKPELVFTKDVLIELYGSHSEMFTTHQIGQHTHVD